jgi:hypothetical protein
MQVALLLAAPQRHAYVGSGETFVRVQRFFDGVAADIAAGDMTRLSRNVW